VGEGDDVVFAVVFGEFGELVVDCCFEVAVVRLVVYLSCHVFYF